AKRDIVRCAIAADKDGVAHVVYSTRHGDRYLLAMRDVSLRKRESGTAAEAVVGEELVADNGWPIVFDVNPKAVTENDGKVAVFSQLGGKDGHFGFDRKLAAEKLRSEVAGWPGSRVFGNNLWTLGATVTSSGDTVWAYDYYHEGDYDIRLVLGQNP